MDLISINFLELFSGTLVGMLLGAFWYSPIAFGPSWMASINKTPETLPSQTIPMLGSIVASFLMAFGVSLLSSWLEINTLSHAVCLGVILGFLIIFPALLSDNLFCNWGIKLLFIQTGYRILTVLLISILVFFI